MEKDGICWGEMNYPSETRQISVKTEINWISAKRCAFLIGKTKDWLLRIGIPSGKAPPWYLVGGRYKWDEEEVIAWREAQRNLTR